jgi:hypothetical protein
MTRIIDTRSKRRLVAKLVVGLAISAFLLHGTFVPPASANGNQSDHHWNKNNYNRGNGSWGGNYYVGPPVVYGTPYHGLQYYGSPADVPPPVIYSPGIGINLPGVSIGVQ